MQLDLAAHVHQNQRQIWVSVIHWVTTQWKAPSLLQAGCSLSHYQAALCLPWARAPPLPVPELQGWGTPSRIWTISQGPSQESLFFPPRRVFKAMLAQCPLCGWPPVPSWIFRDWFQVTVLPSCFDFWAMCSKTTKPCNLSWKIPCLWRSCVHSASFPEDLLYSWYWQWGTEMQQLAWAHVVREHQGLQPGWSGTVQALWSGCLQGRLGGSVG